jgi:hypothetical protein
MSYIELDSVNDVHSDDTLYRLLFVFDDETLILRFRQSNTMDEVKAVLRKGGDNYVEWRRIDNS